MSVKQLCVFLVVVYILNFVYVSERLNLLQLVFSLIIKGLEEVLGGVLLQCSICKVIFIQEGEFFLLMVCQLLVDWDNVEEVMCQSFILQWGKILVVVMLLFVVNVLLEVLKVFCDCYVGVNVMVYDVINEQVIEMVCEGWVEMGIVFELLFNYNLLFILLVVDCFVVIVF